MADLPDDWDPSELIEHALATVTGTMREDGGFAPFAITVDENGGTEGVFPQSIDDMGNNISDMEALIEALRDDAEAGDHAAVAIVADAWIRSAPDAEPKDAIVVHLEYRPGRATKTYFFYSLEARPGDGKHPYHLELGEIETEPVESLIFDPA